MSKAQLLWLGWLEWPYYGVRKARARFHDRNDDGNMTMDQVACANAS